MSECELLLYVSTQNNKSEAVLGPIGSHKKKLNSPV